MALNYGASNPFANPFWQSRRGFLGRGNATPYLNNPQHAGMTPYGGYGSPQTSAWPGGFRDRIFNADDAKQWAGSGAAKLFTNPFTRSQRGLLRQMSTIAGRDVTFPFLNKLSGLYNQYAGMTPYGGSNGSQGYNYMSKMGDIGNQLGSLGAYGGTGGAQGYDYLSQLGNLAQEGPTQISQLENIANLLENSGLTPEQKQQMYNDAYKMAANPTEQRLNRMGMKSVAGEGILGNIAQKTSTQIALDEALRRSQNLQASAGIRGQIEGIRSGAQQFKAGTLSDLASKYFGQGQYEAGFGRQALQDKAAMSGDLASRYFQQGAYESDFMKNLLNQQTGLQQNMAGLEQSGQQNRMAQLASLFSQVRAGEVAPIEYLTALAGGQGVQAAQPYYPPMAKLNDYLGAVNGISDLFGR